MSLSTQQIVIITASLAVVGGVTVYFIAKKDEAPHPSAPPSKKAPKKLAKSPSAAHRFAHAAPRTPQHYAQPQWAQPSASAFRQPAYAVPEQQHAYVAPPPPAAPMVHEEAQQRVDYQPFPMPQPTHAHEWPRAMPSQDVQPSQEMNPTYWRDLATHIGALNPLGKLISVEDAQRYLNTLHAAPNGEVLKIDNDLGSRTRNALSAFQEHHHLPMTGNLDPETSAALIYDSYMLYRAQAGGAS